MCWCLSQSDQRQEMHEYTLKMRVNIIYEVKVTGKESLRFSITHRKFIYMISFNQYRNITNFDLIVA